MMRWFAGKKLLLYVLAGIFSITFAVAPIRAEASSRVGDIIAIAVSQAQVRNAVKHYDTKGRNDLMNEYKKSEGVSRDPAMNAMLDRIMTRMTDAIAKNDSSITEKPYNYFVNEQDSFNAFCSLGNNISVNRGVFTFCDHREDQVAAVVAHELAHGQKRHVQKGINKQLNLAIAQGLLVPKGGLPADLVASHAIAAGVTKPNEWDADNVSFTYMVEAGYNVGATAAVWQRIMDKMGNQPKNFFTGILSPSTHPPHKDRRDNFAKKMHEYSGKKVEVDAANGAIKVKGQVFMSPVAHGDMSGLERAYFIAGNLARAYNEGLVSTSPATAASGLLKIGGLTIATPAPGDKSAAELAEMFNRLNK